MKPGVLSRELKEALGMPDGAPPPWLINMQVKRIFMQLVLWLMNPFVSILTSYKFLQRYGPPPSYPQLKIPGLNAPIPPGASFGYRPGEWGKPPVDEVC
jgi:splicing factor 3B subunit 2